VSLLLSPVPPCHTNFKHAWIHKISPSLPDYCRTYWELCFQFYFHLKWCKEENSVINHCPAYVDSSRCPLNAVQSRHEKLSSETHFEKWRYTTFANTVIKYSHCMCACLTCSALFPMMHGTSLALFLFLNLSFPHPWFSQVTFGHLSSIVSGCPAETHQA
jgi:hypothetical protein